MPDDKIKILYDAVSKDYNLGTFDEFSKKMSDPIKRKAFYDGVGQEYSLGTYDEFNAKITGGLKKKEPSAVSQTPSKSTAPSKLVSPSASVSGVSSYTDLGKEILPKAKAPELSPVQQEQKKQEENKKKIQELTQQVGEDVQSWDYKN